MTQKIYPIEQCTMCGGYIQLRDGLWQHTKTDNKWCNPGHSPDQGTPPEGWEHHHFAYFAQQERIEQ